jgi:hypothetical protein
MGHSEPAFEHHNPKLLQYLWQSCMTSPTRGHSHIDMTASDPYLPLGGDGWSKPYNATATCYCGAVQPVFVSRRDTSSTHTL